MLIASKIKVSYIDLKNEKIDFCIIPEDVLKSFYLWNVEDKKITMNYTYFCDIVKNSSLKKDVLVSIFSNIDEKKDNDFINSFKAARDDI